MSLFESHSSNQHPILIVGAGPTGLTLAIWLHKLLSEQAIRIVSKAATTGAACRAIVIQARTLEFYAQLDKRLVDTIIEKGSIISNVNLWSDGTHKASLNFSNIGLDLTPYPFILSLSQDIHESILLDHLESKGVQVEWDTVVSGVIATADGVFVTMDGKVVPCSYVAACDGGHSVVRDSLGIVMEGGTYEQRFYVADVQLTEEHATNGIMVCLAKDTDYARGLAGVHVPMINDGRARLVGNVPTHVIKPTFEDVRRSIHSSTRLNVSKVNWFSAYHVHHRVASSFRHSSGRVFILGDAAHLHTPVGGQGMNTGIGDSVNLAWKLASVISNPEDTPDGILDTFQQERIAFAKDLVNTTDTLFTNIMSAGFAGWLIRTIIFPHVVPFLWRFAFFRVLYFQRIVSQLAITYRKSELSQTAVCQNKKASIQAGDRLPYVCFDSPPLALQREKLLLMRTDTKSNFTPLASMSWQIHVYGSHSKFGAAKTEHEMVTIHHFPLTLSAKNVGFQNERVYLIRPDGHVALICETLDDELLETYMKRWNVRTRR